MAARLSVALITLNEEQNLARTLTSVQWASELVVVDAGSTDRTHEIARNFGARVVEQPWLGFAAQKNFAISQCTGDWVLSLDADEELTPELQSEIQTLLQKQPTVDAFRLKRRNLFLGRWMRHGGFYPDTTLRLFRRSAARFAQQPVFADRPVHESISHSGPVETLFGDLLHHAYPTLHVYLEHMNRYSDLGADILARKGRTSRSALIFYTSVLLLPQANFCWNYIFRLGFLDGREGLLLHLYQAAYTSWKYAKVWERGR